MKRLLLLTTSLILIVGCTKKTEGPDASGMGASSNGAGSQAAPGGAQPENNIVISVIGETMAYDKTELTVKAGEKITLTLKNPSNTLKHNWVLTKPGKDGDIGMAGIRAGEGKDFIPDSLDILAHTKLVATQGGLDTITFTAPPAGDYPYICTNAGHHMVMKGVLHSK